MTSNTVRILFAVVLLLCLLTVPAAAQDATQAPIPTDAPVVVEEPAAPINPGQILLDINTLVGGAIALFAAGGLTIGAALMALATRFRNNPAEMLAIENLATSVPQPVALAMLQAGKTAIAVGDLLTEAFDGIPAADKLNDLIDRRLNVVGQGVVNDIKQAMTPAAKPEHFEPGRGGHGD